MEEDRYSSGITLKSISLAIIVVAIAYGIFLFSFNPRVGGAFGWFTHYMTYLGFRWFSMWEVFMFPLILIMTLLASFSSIFKLTKQEWTIIYAIVMMVLPSIFWWGIWSWCMNPMLGTEKFKSLLEYVPSLWVPKNFDILASYWESRNPWNWTVPYANAWYPSIIMWVLFYIFLNFMLYGLVLVFQRRMIEIEKLPYPVAMTSYTLINMATTTVSERSARSILWSKKSLVFWIGFIIAVFYDVFYLFPKDIFKHPLFTIPGDVDLQGKFPPFQRSILSYYVTPVHIGLFSLFPLDVLFTAVLFHIIFLIIMPAIFVSTGIYPSERTSEWGAIFGTTWRTKYGFAGTYNTILLYTFLGVALYLLWYYKDDWVKSFKSLFSKEAISSDNEPVSPRTAWLILICGFIGLLGWMAASGINIIGAFIGLVVSLIVWFAVIRYSGEGWNDPNEVWGFRLQQLPRVLSWNLSNSLTGHASTSGYGLGFVTANIIAYQPPYSAIPAIFSYKIANETNTDPKEIFKVQIPTMLLASILSIVIGWYVIGIQGLSNWRHGWTTSWDGALNNGLGAANYVVNAKSPLDGIYSWSIIIGTVLGIIFMFLRTTFPWFYINPIGIPLLTIFNFYVSLSAIIALILKYLVLKIGGSKIYNQYGIPFFIGLFFGSLMTWHIGYPLVLYLEYGLHVIPI